LSLAAKRRRRIITAVNAKVVKKTKTREWSQRLEALKQQIEYWTSPENKTTKTVEIIQLFYDTGLDKAEML
jgi:tripartite-type tricarboxylate transporter receptor subunit TctC